MPAPSASGYRQTHGTIHCIQFLPVAWRHPGVRFRLQIGEPAFVAFLLATCLIRRTEALAEARSFDLVALHEGEDLGFERFGPVDRLFLGQCFHQFLEL